MKIIPTSIPYVKKRLLLKKTEKVQFVPNTTILKKKQDFIRKMTLKSFYNGKIILDYLFF